MTTTSLQKKIIGTLSVLTVLMGCVKDRNFESPEGSCVSGWEPNATYTQVKELYVDGTLQIQDDLIIEGYVVSSDREGNFFSSLHFQDSPENPSEGFQLEFDIRDSHLIYPVGSKIYLKLKGLYLGKQQGVYTLGGVYTSFGNLSVGRLPASIVSQHLFMACGQQVSISPLEVDLEGLEDHMVNTLIKLMDVEVIEEELGSTYAEAEEETERTLIDCDDNQIILLNSGYSDFQSSILPSGSGTVVGVLLAENGDFKVVVRSVNDMDLGNERCAEVVDEFTSNAIFISELADPDNNTGARFVELYNAGTEVLSLKGWSLRRFTNANTEISSTIDLSGFEIASESTFLIAPNASEFETVYGFVPDMGVGSNSPADSNGDDNLQLVDPFGTVIDTFGVIGEDGSGTDHEFEDGRALRKPEIIHANPTFTFNEWLIYNDTGASGTTAQPQNAPTDFSPGSHP